MNAISSNYNQLIHDLSKNPQKLNNQNIVLYKADCAKCQQTIPTAYVQQSLTYPFNQAKFYNVENKNVDILLNYLHISTVPANLHLKFISNKNIVSNFQKVQTNSINMDNQLQKTIKVFLTTWFITSFAMIAIYAVIKLFLIKILS